MQAAGLVLSPREHGQHHLPPFEKHYCILTGWCNAFLDRTHFFRKLEKIVFELTGNKPITWKLDPELEKFALTL
jgi:ubiquitin-conjugating enzyme E2 variant